MSDEIYQMVKGVSESASKPLCKLIDTVRAGAGLVYEPIHIRRVAKAEAEALIIREKAELALSDLRERAAARLSNTETRRQKNIESIVEEATRHLPEDCSEEPVDQDWMADFLDCCKDIGNEDVQSLWGKLLANEVAEPGSYSRRALNALKLMNSVEATLFQFVGLRVSTFNDLPVLILTGGVQHQNWPINCPFAWPQVRMLGDVGLLETEIMNEWDYFGDRNRELTIDYFGQRYVGSTYSGNDVQPRWISFTRLGNELFPLVEPEGGIRDAYFDALNDLFSKCRWQRDEHSEFRELDVSDDIRELLKVSAGNTGK